jgi:hypothetical protein
MRIAIVALDGVFDTGLTVMRDAFQTANDLSGMLLGGKTRIEVRIEGVRRRAASARSLMLKSFSRSAATDSKTRSRRRRSSPPFANAAGLPPVVSEWSWMRFPV